MNHQSFFCFILCQGEYIIFKCFHLTLSKALYTFLFWRKCAFVSPYVMDCLCAKRDKNRQSMNQGGIQVKRNPFFFCFHIFSSELSYSLIRLSVCSPGPVLWYHLRVRVSNPLELWSSEGSVCGGDGAPWENIVGAFQRQSQVAVPLSLPLQ